MKTLLTTFFVSVAIALISIRVIGAETLQEKKQNILPIVNIESPSVDTEVLEGETIKILGNALDLDGEILEVEFYANKNLIGSAYESPFQLNWNNAPLGNHTLSILAKDNNQAISISEPVNIKVVKNTKEKLFKIGSQAPEVTTAEYVHNINLGSNQNANWEMLDFEGETAVKNQFIVQSNIFSNNHASKNALFQTERNGEAFQMEILVPNGTYTIKTYHNELWFGHKGPNAQKGRRVFDIFVQDKLVENNLDLYAENENRPTILTFENIEVNNGVLQIDLKASQYKASISGIAIIPSRDSNSPIQKQNLRGYREMIGRGYKEMHIQFDEVITEKVSDKINLFPNPARDEATLEIPTEIGEGRVLVHDMSGQLIRHFDLNWIRSTPNKFTIPLDNVAQGVYIISISKDKNILSRQRLIVNP